MIKIGRTNRVDDSLMRLGEIILVMTTLGLGLRYYVNGEDPSNRPQRSAEYRQSTVLASRYPSSSFSGWKTKTTMLNVGLLLSHSKIPGLRTEKELCWRYTGIGLILLHCLLNLFWLCVRCCSVVSS